MDINMIPFSGIEATRQIREVSPEIPHYWCYHAFTACLCKKNAATGCERICDQKFLQEEMINAILEVSKGNKFVCEEIKELIAESH